MSIACYKGGDNEKLEPRIIKKFLSWTSSSMSSFTINASNYWIGLGTVVYSPSFCTEHIAWPGETSWTPFERARTNNMTTFSTTKHQIWSRERF
jgi:hypothetical protein